MTLRGDGPAYIPPEVFIDCPKLTEVSFGKNITFIDGGAFERCGLRELSIPASVTEIGEGAFQGCEKLTIYAPAGSYPESYASENGIPCAAVE